MELLLTGGTVYRGKTFVPADIAVSNGRIVSVSPTLSREGRTVIELNDVWIVPGFVDVHVHLREPGFSYKETIASGTAAAAAGGYTAVCAMPNLSPVPDCGEHLQTELDAIARDALVRVYPYGALTAGERGETLADLPAMAGGAVGFSDDGRGVQSEEMMLRAMECAKALDKPIAAHCEDEALVQKGWCVNDGDCARRFGLPGNDPASEYRQVRRDIELVRRTGCRYHVCHVSTRQSVAAVRAAKAEGLPVTCETAPHYLILCDRDVENDGRFKMNPPIRSAADRQALVEGLLDGTVDCIATDHAPHAAREKAGGLDGSLNGVVGLETAFPILYTCLTEPGIVPLEILLRALCVRPREIFGLPGGKIAPGEIADLTVIDPRRPHRINSASFRSLGRSTPFDGRPVSAAVILTLCGGRVVYGGAEGEKL
ncbi:MAG: dihydroorotase [Oscillibacter sp.]|nr:dihydroorotase [Oscillibacter sp.]